MREQALVVRSAPYASGYGSLSTAGQLRRRHDRGGELLPKSRRIERISDRAPGDYFRPWRKVADAAIREVRRVVKEGAVSGGDAGVRWATGEDVTWTGR